MIELFRLWIQYTLTFCIVYIRKNQLVLQDSNQLRASVATLMGRNKGRFLSSIILLAAAKKTTCDRYSDERHQQDHTDQNNSHHSRVCICKVSLGHETRQIIRFNMASTYRCDMHLLCGYHTLRDPISDSRCLFGSKIGYACDHSGSGRGGSGAQGTGVGCIDHGRDR